jgi:hypothetical protein
VHNEGLMKEQMCHQDKNLEKALLGVGQELLPTTACAHLCHLEHTNLLTVQGSVHVSPPPGCFLDLPSLPTLTQWCRLPLLPTALIVLCLHCLVVTPGSLLLGAQAPTLRGAQVHQHRWKKSEKGPAFE